MKAKKLLERIREWIYDLQYPGRETTERFAAQQIEEIDRYLCLLSEFGSSDKILRESVRDYLHNHQPENLAHVMRYGRRDTTRCLEAKMWHLKQAYELVTSNKDI